MEISIYSTIDFSKSRNLLTERQKNIKAFNPIVPEGGCISLLELNPKQYTTIIWTLINEKTGKITETTAESSDAMHYVAIPEGLRFGTYKLKVVTKRTEDEELITETTISNPFEFVEASEDVVTIVSRNLENDLVGNVPPNATIVQPIYVNYPDIYKLTATITIAVADWSGGTTCTKSVAGLLASDIVLPVMDRANFTLYSDAYITADSSVAGEITFTCETTPTAQIVIPLEIIR
jgi:hypothetical protein